MTQPCDLSVPPHVALAAVVHFGPGRFQWRMEDHWTLVTYPEATRLLCDGRPMALPAHSVGLFPPGSCRVYEARATESHAVAHLRLVGGERQPSVRTLGAAFTHFHAALAEAAGWWPERSERVKVRLWDLLWQLADADLPQQVLPPAVERARVHLERCLDEPLTVRDLARAGGCSTSQLLRLVRASCGCPVTTWMRRYRIERAKVLLASSPMPIAEVGRHVGLPDPQHFNKVFRSVAGLSPRTWRERHGAAPQTM